MNKKNSLWILTVILIFLGLSAMLGFVHTQGVDAGKTTQTATESDLRLFNYDKVIMQKIKECSISKVASKKASYLAGLIAEQASKTDRENKDETVLSMNQINKNSNNTQLHFSNR